MTNLKDNKLNEQSKNHTYVMMTVWAFIGLMGVLLFNSITFQWDWLPQTTIIVIPSLVFMCQVVGWVKNRGLFGQTLNREERYLQAFPIIISLMSDGVGVLILLTQLQAFDGSQRDFIYVLVMSVLFKLVFIVMILAMRFKRAVIVDVFLSILSFGLSFILYALAVTV